MKFIRLVFVILAMAYCLFIGIACLVALYGTFGPFWMAVGTMLAIGSAGLIHVWSDDFVEWVIE